MYSTTATRVGAGTIVQGRHATGTLYSYWDSVPADGYQWVFRAHGSIGAIPTNGGTCVFVSIPAHRFREEVHGNPTAAYRRLVREVSPPFADHLESATQLEPVHGFGGLPGFIKRGSGMGWALVGDAGYFKDPLTAHGITDALRDAELLARAVLAGTDAAFAEYEATRLSLSQRLLEVTDDIASFAWTDATLQNLHREFSREMSREVKYLASLEPLSCPSPSANALHAV
jgi:2-polyprenyl-6-methoxyphenol hydroxylase-like FAD-dependent oxidoreductase